MLRKSIFLSILLLAPGVAHALPSGCSALASDGPDLWIVPAGQAPRRVLSDKRMISAGAWSPDGQQIAFSTFTNGFAPEIVVAAQSGRILGHFTVDRPQSENGLRYIDGMEWFGQQTFVTLGNVGPHGGFMDVWRTDKSYTRAERVRRSNALVTANCRVSPSTRYLACDDDFRITITDTLAGPPDEDRLVEDKHPFEIASYGREDDLSEGVVGNLAWGTDDLRLYAVRRLRSKLLLTTLERDPGSEGGWSVTDRSLVGIDTAGGVDVEVDAHGGLTLSDDRHAYVLDGGTSSARRDAVARAIPATALRRPREMDVRSDSGTLHLTVLDTYCGRR
jgi:hypothetical protein